MRQNDHDAVAGVLATELRFATDEERSGILAAIGALRDAWTKASPDLNHDAFNAALGDTSPPAPRSMSVDHRVALVALGTVDTLLLNALQRIHTGDTDGAIRVLSVASTHAEATFTGRMVGHPQRIAMEQQAGAAADRLTRVADAAERVSTDG